jgi:hypothetical protein
MFVIPVIILIILIYTFFKYNLTILSLLGIAFIIFVILPFVIIAGSVNLGYKPLIGTGMSNCPEFNLFDKTRCTIPPGSLILLKSPGNYTVGKIACYGLDKEECFPNKKLSAKGDVVCHQIISASKGITLKGTANKIQDPCSYPPEQMMGSVELSIPLLGAHVYGMQTYMASVNFLIEGNYIVK